MKPDAAGEKGLKAFLYFRGAREVRGHAAGELCDDAATLDPAFHDLRPVVVLADKYYIPTRYPNGLTQGGLPFEAYDAEDAAKAIRMARQALDFIRPRLASAVSEPDRQLSPSGRRGTP